MGNRRFIPVFTEDSHHAALGQLNPIHVTLNLFNKQLNITFHVHQSFQIDLLFEDF
jgi:hypothetical protein